MSVPDPATTDWVPLWSLGTPASGLVGAPVPWLVSAIPSGYIEFAGQTITSAAYPQLYALFGATLPDLRGQTLMGQNATYPIGTTGGEASHLLSASESGLPQHSHLVLYYRDHPIGDAGQAGPLNPDQVQFSRSTTDAGPNNAAQAHNNLPPYRTVRWITIAG